MPLTNITHFSKKNIIFHLIIVITIFFLIVSLSGCIDNSSNIVNKNNNNKISDQYKFIGKWETDASIVDSNILNTYIFYENGTFLSTYIIYSPSETHKGWGDYNLTDGKLCMKTHPHGAITDNDAYCYDYTFYDDNHVKLSTSGLPTVTLIKT
jgi:hypothetical protein